MLVLLLLLMDIAIGVAIMAMSGSWVMGLVAYVVCTAISLYVIAV